MKKGLSIIVLLLLTLSSFSALAATDDCSGFVGFFKCFFSGRDSAVVGGALTDIQEYCLENPNDAECRDVTLPNPDSANTVEGYCQDNPSDPECSLTQNDPGDEPSPPAGDPTPEPAPATSPIENPTSNSPNAVFQEMRGQEGIFVYTKEDGSIDNEWLYRYDSENGWQSFRTTVLNAEWRNIEGRQEYQISVDRLNAQYPDVVSGRSTPPSIEPLASSTEQQEQERRDAAQEELGDLYDLVQGSIDWGANDFDPSNGYPVEGTEEQITIINTGGVTIVTIPNPPIEGQDDPGFQKFYLVDGRQIARQSAEQQQAGTLSFVGDEGNEQVYVGEEFDVDQFTFYDIDPDLRDEPLGEFSVITTGETTITKYTHFERETQVVIIHDRTDDSLEQFSLEGDVDEQEFHPDNAIWQKNGETVAILDYDYINGELSEIEALDPHTGFQSGVALDDDNDGIPDRRIMQIGDDQFEVTTKSGISVIYTKSENGNWVAQGESVATAEELNQAQSIAAAGSRQQTLGTIYTIAGSTREYSALNSLFQDSEFISNWQTSVDQAFSPLLGEQWFPSAICGRWQDRIPENIAVIETPTGIDVAVASIQGERTNGQSLILCQQNPDEEAEERFICSTGQVCVEDTFCYLDSDRDGQPDGANPEPLQGYFYTITFGVRAPADVGLTPSRNENSAVSFNIVLDPGTQNEVRLYNNEGDTAGPIRLKNGQSYGTTVVQYSSRQFTEACIIWNQAPQTKQGLTQGDLRNICFPFVESQAGQVQWEGSGRAASGSQTPDTGVSLNTNW